MSKNNKPTVGSFFAGVGGIDLAFEMAGFDVVYANEIDKNAAVTYNLNFKVPVDNRDIHDVKAKEIPNFDVITGGFPCQAFSIAGYRQGFDDEKGRGKLFFEIVRLIEEKKAMGAQPKVVFLENVKNFKAHDNGNTFKVVLSELEKLGYKVYEKVLNASQYGNIPQNRERIYIVGFLDHQKAEQFSFDNIQPIELKRSIKDVIVHEDVDDRFYYSSKFPHYDKLLEVMTKEDTMYQWRRQYVRENKSSVCPTLTANMGTGGHNVPLVLTNNKIRKLTPRECFSFQGFPKQYCLPKTMALSHLYKQAGNSVVVPVIERIAKEIVKAM